MKRDVARWALTIGAILFMIAVAVTGFSSAFPSLGSVVHIGSFPPLTEPIAVQADQALKQRDFTAAVRTTRAELALSPVHERPWIRLARIDVAQHGRLTAVGVKALDHAYDAVPYDLDPDTARLPLVLSHFGELDPSTASTGMDELAAWSSSPELGDRLAALSAGADGAGRAAIQTALAQSRDR